MTEIEETSKAIAEAAKLGTKALDSGDKLGGFLSSVFGVSIENAVGLMGDKLEYMRWERRSRMVDRVNEFSKERGLMALRPIPPKFAIPMIENASLEEEDDLQDIWCKLITNSLDPNFDSEIRYSFIEIIKNLTFLDAQILKTIYDSAVSWSIPRHRLLEQGNYPLENESKFFNREVVRFGINKIVLIDKIDCSHQEMVISIDNLLRVQCMRDSTLDLSVGRARNIKDITCSNERYSLTPLGVAFIKACID